MTKSKFKIKYSKTSIIIRIILSLFLVTAIFLVVGLRVPISRKIYNWDAAINGEPDFSVHFIDVGQGDATLIEFDDGKNMLIDCGPKSAASSLVTYIENLGVEKIDYFLITHADADHVGGGVKIFQNFEIKNFYRPMMLSRSETEPSDYPHQPKPSDVYDDIINIFYEEEDAKMFYTSEATKIVGENYEVNILYPDKPYSNTNASSAVVQANLNGNKFLFMGDAGISEENKIIASYGNSLKSEVLKVGHHGSDNSTSEAFLSYVDADYAIISAGEGNSYGHPHKEVVDKLNAFDMTILTTIDQGDIVIETQHGQIFAGVGKGKMIDYALIAAILGFILLLVWGVPDLRHKSSQKKVVKK